MPVKRSILNAERRVHGVDQSDVSERFSQEADRPSLLDPLFQLVITVRRHEDNGYWADAGQTSLKLNTIEIRHANVEHRARYVW